MRPDCSSKRSRVATPLVWVVNSTRAAALCLIAILAGCVSDVTEPGVAVTVTVSAPTTTLAALGQTVQLTVSAEDALGEPVSNRVTWESSDESVATVSAMGLVTAVANGNARITATMDGVEGAITITVSQVPTAVVVTPSSSTLSAIAATVQLTAEAEDANGNTIAGQAFGWTSSDDNIASVSATGLVAAVANGTATIRATAGTLEATATITVAQVVTQVTISPPTVTLASVGDTYQLNATPLDANDYPVAAATTTWSTSNTGVAAVSSSGVVTAVSNGTATITATSDGVTSTATITVQQVVVTLTVSPPSPVALLLTETVQLAATATDNNGNTIPGVAITWQSSNTNVASVSPAGLVTAVGPGSATISATAGGVTANVTVAVSGTSQVVLTPATPQELNALGATVQFTAEAQDAGGNVVPGQVFTWSSSDPTIATVSQTGLVTAITNAPTSPVTISATTAGVSGGQTVTVNQLAISVTVTGGGILTALGQTLQLTVTAPDANGHQVRPVVCTSSNPSIVSVDAACIVTAEANGTATITATAGGKSGTATVTVTQVPTVLNISPQVLPLQALGASGTLTAQLLDQRGNVVRGVDVMWRSLNPLVAAVAEVVPETTPSTATVTAVANGTATIEATTSVPAPGGLSATAIVPVGQIADPTKSTAAVPDGIAGASTPISIQARDANGALASVGGATVIISITGSNARADITATDNGNGTYSASYTPTVAGSDNIAITMDPDGSLGPAAATSISGSPFTSTVAPGLAAAANSTAPNPFPGGVAGEVTTFIVTLKDAFNNLVGTDAKSAAAVVSGSIGSPNAGATVTAVPTDPADGTWTLSYTPLNTGDDDIFVTLDPDGTGPLSPAAIGTAAGLPAGSASPFTSTVTPGQASAAHTSANVPDGIAGQPTNITVTLNDANDNLVGTDALSTAAVVVGSITGGPNTGASTTATNNGDGTWTVFYTPIGSGDDLIAISLDPDGTTGPLTADPIGTAPGVPGGPSPFTSTVTASGPSAAFSTAAFDPVPPATAGVPVTITIQARDAQDNAITVGGAFFLVTVQSGPNYAKPVLDPDGVAGPLPASWANVVAQDQGDGTYTVIYTPTVSGGTDQIAVTLNSVPIGMSPLAAQVIPARVTAANTMANVPVDGIAGVETEVTVTLRDEFDNLVGSDPASQNAVVTWSVVPSEQPNGTGLDLILNAPQNNGDGTWTLKYTPRDPDGQHQINIELDPDGTNGDPALPIGQSPFNHTVAPAQADPAKTTAVVSPLPSAWEAGVTTEVTVTLKDQYGNPVGSDSKSTNAVVTASVTSGPNNGTGLTGDRQNGTWPLSYTPEVAGPNEAITIYLNPDGTGAQPIGEAAPPTFTGDVAPGPAVAAQTTADVPAGEAGQVTTIVVTLKDANGNPVGNSTNADVTASVAGDNAGLPVTGDDNNNDGVWELSYTPTKAGQDQITIYLDTGSGPESIGAGTFTSNVAPGPVKAAYSTAVLETAAVPDVTVPGATTPAGDIISITVQARDQYGNPVTSGAAAVAVQVGALPLPVMNEGTGVYTSSYRPTVAGPIVISITLDPPGSEPAADIGTAAGLNPSPFSTTIVAGPPSAAQTTAVVPAGLGGVPTEITVTVRDLYGNLKAGAAASIAAAITPLGETYTVDEVGNGIYKVTYTPLDLGDDNITITVNGTQIPGGPFTSTVTAAQLSITTQPATQAAGGVAFTRQPVIQLKDGAGNNVTQAGAQVTATIATGGGTLGGTTTATTNASGVAAFANLSIDPGLVGDRTLQFALSNQPPAVTSDPTTVGVAVGSGTWASTPDDAALDITGDIDLRCLCQADSWMPAIMNVAVSKSSSSGLPPTLDELSYALVINTDGTLAIRWTTDGTTLSSESSTIPTAFSDGSAHWIRATLHVSLPGTTPPPAFAYRATFYTSEDGVSWTLLGDYVPGTTTTSIHSGGAEVLVGAEGILGFQGRIHRAQIYRGVDGTLEFDADFSRALPTAGTLTERSANGATVTINP